MWKANHVIIDIQRNIQSYNSVASDTNTRLALQTSSPLQASLNTSPNFLH